MRRRTLLLQERPPGLQHEPFASFLKWEADHASNTYDGNSPPNLVTAFDISGNSRTGTTSGVNGPAYQATAMNSQPAWEFTGTVTNGTISQADRTWGRNRSIIGVTICCQFTSIAAVNLLNRLLGSSGNKFTLRANADRTLECFSRRVVADSDLSPNTVTSLITLDARHVIRVWWDYFLCTFNVQLDNSPVETLLTPAGWATAPYFGFTDNVDAQANPSFGYFAAASELRAYVSYVHEWNGPMSDADAAAEFSYLQAKYDTVQITLDIPDRPSARMNQVWQRAAVGGCVVPLRVMARSGHSATGDILVKLIDFPARTMVVDWATLGAMTGGDTTFNHTFPDGSFKVLYKRNGEVDACAIEGEEIIGVGDREIDVGDSLGRDWSSRPSSTDTPYSAGSGPLVAVPVPATHVIHRNRRWSWDKPYQPAQRPNTSYLGVGTLEPLSGPTQWDTAGNALVLYCYRYNAAKGYPVMRMLFNVGGTAFSEWAGVGTTYFDRMKELLEGTVENPGPGWDCARVRLAGGGSNIIIEGVSQTAREDEMLSIFNAIRAEYQTETGKTGADLHCQVVLIAQRTTSASDTAADTLRDAMQNLPTRDANVQVVAIHSDQPTSDGAHYTPLNNAIHGGDRLLQDTLFWDGDVANDATGPHAASETIATGADDAYVTFTLNGGTSLCDAALATTGSGFTGFDLKLVRAAVTTIYENVAAEISTATVMKLTQAGLTAAPGDAISWRYAGGKEWDTTKPLYNNFAYLGQTKAALASTQWRLVTIT